MNTFKRLLSAAMAGVLALTLAVATAPWTFFIPVY